jgi:predicted transcriptional regulator of viral defense system
LIQFERRIGGITRAATVISELSEIIKPSDFSALLVRHVQTTTLQRLGYLLEMICGRLDLAEALFKAMKTESQNFFRIPLKVRSLTKGFASDNQWNVIVNTTIDLDE